MLGGVSRTKNPYAEKGNRVYVGAHLMEYELYR
jgi:hypothetical protein